MPAHPVASTSFLPNSPTIGEVRPPGGRIVVTPADVPPQDTVMEKKVLSILIVEDNADARESLVALLEMSGHRVAAADSGNAALSGLSGSLPQLMLIDIGLPDIDGFALARRIRELPGADRIRLIALTGYGSAEDQARATASGFDAHLIKPLDLDALEELLQRMGNPQ
jgi:CheY-like chemotaxis protein